MQTQTVLMPNEDNHHDPLDLELTLDVGPRQEKRKRSGCKQEDNGGDQEVESAATGLSLSLFPSSPARTSSHDDSDHIYRD